ncbi:divergent PAP2 family protein [Pullulanibacillus sp. KACC 23026]|uniref:divergent PAP2 family protein n=1 Tax=Pullulanibacillus sp. KACC 23026 TaxID=3028315 RepID=UPI0023B1EF57|nr:divergent PAP2 family protein [Pullulanibacillus sp. KACC 23026]WEG12486.1 divergent PAP2 family protein [Pullulanibacillus sp. KACC 23026]
MNRSLMTALIGIGTAQFLKIPLEYIQTGEWHWEKFLETGSMPSSHSASCSALSTYVAFKKGLGSIEFGISSLLSLIVMYDAMGIRRQAGEIAMAVNKLDLQVERLSGEQPGVYHHIRHKKLNEMLGHLPREVAGGAVLGAVIGTISYLTEKK